MEWFFEMFEMVMTGVVVVAVIVVVFRIAGGATKYIEVTDKEREQLLFLEPDMYWTLPRKKDADE